MKVKQNDTVLVITGKDKGKTGEVLRIDSKRGRVVVSKVAIRTKHVKKTAQKAGEIVKYEAFIDASNVMVVCPSCKKATRAGYEVPKEGKKVRICKKCNKPLDKKIAKVKAKK